jgi:hypothetical protein
VAELTFHLNRHPYLLPKPVDSSVPPPPNIPSAPLTLDVEKHTEFVDLVTSYLLTDTVIFTNNLNMAVKTLLWSRLLYLSGDIDEADKGIECVSEIVNLLQDVVVREKCIVSAVQDTKLQGAEKLRCCHWEKDLSFLGAERKRILADLSS